MTGAENSAPPSVQRLIERIKARTQKPVLVGFGISTPEQVSMVCKHADGAVVGSKLVQLLNDTWDNGRGSKTVTEFIKSLKLATRNLSS